MWLVRFGFISIGIFVQLLFLADLLNEIESGVVVLQDVTWVFVFAPSIIWLIFMALLTLASYVYGTCGWFVQTPNPNTQQQPMVVDVYDDDGNLSQQQIYAGPDEIQQASEKVALARIYLFDALLDTVVLICLSVFIGLLVDQLERLGDGDASNDRSWFAVFAPLIALLVFLLFAFLFAALRVCGEERYQRPLENGEYVGAACAGVVVCCQVREKEMDDANMLRRDKRPAYLANDGFHELPCVFCCTPSMTFGLADWALSILLTASLVVFGFVLLALARRLDGMSTTSLNTIFIALYVVEGFVILFSLITFFMLVCYWRHTTRRPRGRARVFGKYWELLLLILASIAFIVQQVLLAARIDNGGTADWFVVFLPLFLLAALAAVAGCASLSCGRGARIALTHGGVIDTGSGVKIQFRSGRSAWGVLQ